MSGKIPSFWKVRGSDRSVADHNICLTLAACNSRSRDTYEHPRVLLGYGFGMGGAISWKWIKMGLSNRNGGFRRFLRLSDSRLATYMQYRFLQIGGNSYLKPGKAETTKKDISVGPLKLNPYPKRYMAIILCPMTSNLHMQDTHLFTTALAGVFDLKIMSNCKNGRYARDKSPPASTSFAIMGINLL